MRLACMLVLVPAISLLNAASCAPASPPARDTVATAPPSQATPAVADTDHVVTLTNRTLGAAGAPVTVYEMSDFACPFCRQHALVTLPKLDSAYIRTGKVRYIFVNYPITEIHPNAVAAAEIGLCAARQGKFWPLHHLLFESQQSWTRLSSPAAALLTLADSAGVDHEKVLACLEEPRVREAVQAEAQGAARTGARATPTFYIEGGLLVGAQPFDVWQPILDSILVERSRS